MKRTDQERKQEMYQLLTNWEKSGLGQKEFCKKNGINYSVFKYWNKKRNQVVITDRLVPVISVC